MSNVLNYQSKLEAFFETVLINSGKSTKTKTNYKSDLNHFLNWISKLFVKLEIYPKNESDFLSYIQPETITAYINWQQKCFTPIATINRHLSSVRMFFRVANTSQIIKNNPTKFINNVKIITPNSQTKPSSMIGEFKISLLREGAAKSTIKNYSSDIADFIFWITNTNQTK
jgi:site-specific recombinase XerD